MVLDVAVPQFVLDGERQVTRGKSCLLHYLHHVSDTPIWAVRHSVENPRGHRNSFHHTAATQKSPRAGARPKRIGPIVSPLELSPAPAAPYHHWPYSARRTHSMLL